MKALTIWQPWASLLMAGVKAYETRGWAPPAAMMGQRVAIHAAAMKKGLELYTDAMTPFGPLAIAAEKIGMFDGVSLPFGAILGTARLAFVLETTGALGDEVMASEKALGDWTEGRYAWRLTDHQVLATPIPWKGQQGLWNFDDQRLEVAAWVK